jgi:transposase
MIKDNALRRQLKEQRIARGYPTLVSPRTGLKGWVQKKFRDPKEQRLPITLDILAWLKELPRLQLLVAIHDGILAQVSSAEPRPVGADQQMNQFINPLAEMIRDNDASRIERVRQALAEPLPSIPAATVVDELAGYVISYDRNRGVAYYYGS